MQTVQILFYNWFNQNVDNHLSNKAVNKTNLLVVNQMRWQQKAQYKTLRHAVFGNFIDFISRTGHWDLQNRWGCFSLE